jgi:hypothetical protein
LLLEDTVANQRIKGQEVEISVLVDGVTQLFTDINSFEMSSVTETKEEGYLGEKADRYDEFYKGYTGSFKMHNSSGELFKFMQIVKDRAQRRTPGVKINVKATLNFPSGDRSRVNLNDAFFEPMGASTGSRDAYAESTISFKGSDYRVL